ncbi:MAG TPA: hypothetical protein VGR78_01820, partial [Verrucomicrobiae bacterium]|nr:hypothetical protein [Verrucomicrobiae bacterium]
GEALQFPASAGTIYVISVDGVLSTKGDIALNIAMQSPSLAAAVDATGKPSFTLTGSADLDYVIQTSTDLSNWRSVMTYRVSAGGVIQISGALPTSGSARYFRAVLP